jgi:hypothetical protein
MVLEGVAMQVHRYAPPFIGLVLLAVAGLVAWLVLRPASGPLPSPAVPAAAVPAPAPAEQASAPAEHPISEVAARVAAASDAAPNDPAGLPEALERLLGRQAVLGMLQVQDFPRRLVATVDNLGREAAPAQAWPVNPTAGRFLVREEAGRLVIDADNGLRYAPFVQLIESVDLRDAVALYLRSYPELQQAYESIGFPGRHFNTRLVEVVDLLLATPLPAGPIEVVLPAIRGPHQPPRPWVLYEFADPSLRGLSAGQQWLLRMGPVNQRRLQARLAEFRTLIARPQAGQHRP